MISIDGSYLEGGGQICRTALALSAISQKPFDIFDIRKGRKEPGLKSQHLYCVKSLKQLCSAVVEGDELGSTRLKFWPRKITAKNLDIEIGTAGSITLLMQSLLLPSIFVSKPITIALKGGTDTKWSQPYDYFANILLPQLQKFAKIESKLLKRGYYPKGNGKVDIKISPKFKLGDFSYFEEFAQHLKQNINSYGLDEQHHLIKIDGISHASRSLERAKVAERQADSCKHLLKQKYGVPINISIQYQDTDSPGSGLTLWAIFSKKADDIDENNPIRIGADSLGEQGKRSELVGEEAARNLIREIGSEAPVDKFLADQLLPFMALTKDSEIRASSITPHCRTNIYTIQQFFGDIFEIDEQNKIIKTLNRYFL